MFRRAFIVDGVTQRRLRRVRSTRKPLRPKVGRRSVLVRNRRSRQHDSTGCAAQNGRACKIAYHTRAWIASEHGRASGGDRRCDHGGDLRHEMRGRAGKRPEIRLRLFATPRSSPCLMANVLWRPTAITAIRPRWRPLSRRDGAPPGRLTCTKCLSPVPKIDGRSVLSETSLIAVVKSYRRLLQSRIVASEYSREAAVQSPRAQDV